MRRPTDTRVGGRVRPRWGAHCPSAGHAWEVDSVIGGVPSARSAGYATRPGALIELLVTGVRTGRLWRPAWPTLILVLTIGAVVFGRAHRGVFPALALTLAALATAPLLLVRRWPVVVLPVVVAAAAVFVVDARLSWPPTAVVAWLLALALCPLLLRRPQALALLAGSEAAVLAAVFVPVSVNPRPWDAPITEALAVLLVWGAGETFRARQEAEADRVRVAVELRGLQEREAVARGRAEIARELHDVVAHHVSLIAVRAATAPYQLQDLSPAASDVLTEIAGQARTALDELRTVLGVLRSPDGAILQAPQPKLADLPELLQRMRANGMTVAVETDGTPAAMTAPVELCCYRVIQEALTNAARHAPGAPVELTVSYRPGRVALTITNRVGVASAPDGPVVPGFGLIGMRERVIGLGGTVSAGRDDMGFRIDVCIPAPLAEQLP
jgi:signal transduction histidine kinase